MRQLLSRWFLRAFVSTKPRRPQPRQARLHVEGLETRAVPAAFVSAGVLTIQGTAAADSATVSLITVNGVPTYQVRLNGVTTNFAASAVTTRRLSFTGGDGNDVLRNNT